MIWVWMLVGIASGALFAAQGPVNARLAPAIGGPLMASLVSFIVGAAILFAINAFTLPQLPSATQAAGVPWWAWIGGSFGVAVVTLTVIAVPKIGVAAWVSALIAGQLAASVLYDHYGAFGQAVREVNWQKLIGVALLLAGAWFVRRF